MPNQEHERERDQTHGYWYIPSAPRVNYSLLVMESAGMMKMATGEGFPLRQGAGTGLDWFSVATEASGGGTHDLFCPPMFLGYIDIYIGERSRSGEPRGVHEAGWHDPYLVPPLKLPLRALQVFWASFLPKMGSVKFQVNWTLFGFPFRRYSKTR